MRCVARPLGVAVAQRSGMAIDVVGNGDRARLAHRDGGCALASTRARRTACSRVAVLGADLDWRCAHELAALDARGRGGARRALAGTDVALRVVRPDAAAGRRTARRRIRGLV